MAGGALAFVAFVGVALADKPVKLKPADCEPLDEAAFRSFVLDAQAALDRDDAALNAQILTELDQRIPCLTFAPPPRVWADLLVSKAITAFAAQGDWQTPLAAAVRVRPQIDRGVGSAHPIGKWEPPAGDATVSAGPLPAGVELWVDGVAATELPPVAGLHLVQRQSEGQWVSVVLRDEPISPDWLTGVIVQPLTVVIDGQISGGWQGFGVVQTHLGWESDYVATGGEMVGGPVVTARAMARVRQAAVLADASGRFLEFDPLELAHADVALGARLRPRLYAAIGGGLYRYPTFLGSACFTKVCSDPGDPAADPPPDGVTVQDERDSLTIDWINAVQVSGMLAWYGRNVDAPVRGGATFSSRGRQWTMSGWWTHRLDGSWFYGLNASVYGAEFVQVGMPDRHVTVGGGTLGLELGTRFGLDL